MVAIKELVGIQAGTQEIANPFVDESVNGQKERLIRDFGEVADPIAFYNNTSLIFRLVKGDLEKDNPTVLSPQSFSK